MTVSSITTSGLNRIQIPSGNTLYPAGEPVCKILDNGLRIIVDKMPGKLTTNLVITVFAGGVDDPSGLSGLAHCTEHIFCEGTDRPGQRSFEDIRRTLSDLGEEINAGTNKVFTQCTARVQNEDLYVPLGLYLDLIFCASPTSEKVAKHKEIILRERANRESDKEADDTPGEILRKLRESMYSNHPLFSVDVIGTEESISRIRTEDVAGFMHKLYTPDNVVISICGNVNPDEVFRFIEEKVAGIRRQRDKSGILPFKVNPEIYRGTSANFQHAMLRLHANGPTVLDDPTARYATTLLNGGLQSRLFAELRERRFLDYSPGAFYSPDPYDGKLAISTNVPEARAIEALEIIALQIDQLKQHGLTDEEVSLLHRQLKLAILKLFEDSDFRVNINGLNMLFKGSGPDLVRELEGIFTLPNHSVPEQAASLFRPGNVGLVAAGKDDLPTEEQLKEVLRSHSLMA